MLFSRSVVFRVRLRPETTNADSGASISREWINPSRRATTSTAMPTADGSRRRRFRPTKRVMASGAELVDKTRKQTLGIIEDAWRRRRSANGGYAQNWRLSTRRSWTRQAIESKGAAPLKPQFDEIAAIMDRRDLARVIGSRIRADVDALNNTNFETEQPVRRVGDSRPDRPGAHLPLSAARRPGIAGPRLLSLRQPAYGRVAEAISGASSAAMFQLAGLQRPRSARGARIRAGDGHRRSTCNARCNRKTCIPRSRGTAPIFRRKRPDWIGPRCWTAAGLKDAPVFIAWQPAAITGLSALTAKQPLDAWKDWLAFHAIEDARSFLSEGIRG